MPQISFSAALAAQVLAERRNAPAQVALQLELPVNEPGREDSSRLLGDDDGPVALVLEADGTFREIRD